MRIARLAVGAASLLLLGAAASARAEDEEPSEDFARDGWYVGVHGVYGVEDWENPGGSSVSNAWGIGARVGYRFLEHWALEFEYERILEFRVDAAPTRPDLKADANVFTLNGKAFLPLGRLHPYLVAGFGLHQTDIDDGGIPLGQLAGGESGTGTGRFGGGAEFYLTANLVLTSEASYVIPLARDNGKLHYVSMGLGVEWRFDPFEY